MLLSLVVRPQEPRRRMYECASVSFRVYLPRDLRFFSVFFICSFVCPFSFSYFYFDCSAMRSLRMRTCEFFKHSRCCSETFVPERSFTKNIIINKFYGWQNQQEHTHALAIFGIFLLALAIYECRMCFCVCVSPPYPSYFVSPPQSWFTVSSVARIGFHVAMLELTSVNCFMTNLKMPCFGIYFEVAVSIALLTTMIIVFSSTALNRNVSQNDESKSINSHARHDCHL